jgi:hypothetical protein
MSEGVVVKESQLRMAHSRRVFMEMGRGGMRGSWSLARE